MKKLIVFVLVALLIVAPTAALAQTAQTPVSISPTEIQSRMQSFITQLLSLIAQLQNLLQNRGGGCQPGFIYNPQTGAPCTQPPQDVSIIVLSPNGGENWPIGSRQTMSWRLSGYPSGPGSTVLYMNLEGGPTPGTIVTLTSVNSGGNPGSYQVIVPSTVGGATPPVQLQPGNYKLELALYVDAGCLSIETPCPSGGPLRFIAQDTSDGFITISPALPNQPSITVTSPNGGEEWNDGQSYPISWNAANAPAGSSVKLWVVGVRSDGSESDFYQLAEGRSASGSYQWTARVPGEYKLKAILFDANNNIIATDLSDSKFRVITPSASYFIRVTAPNGGEELLAGEPTTIRWSSAGIRPGASIRLRVYPAGGTPENQVWGADTTNASGSFIWNIPTNFTRGSYLLRVLYVTEAGAHALADVSDAPFYVGALPPPLPPPPPSAPTVDIKVNGQDGPLAVVVPAAFTLSWATTGEAVSCVSSGDWTASNRPLTGSLYIGDVTRIGPYTYRLTCSNTAGQASDEVRVNVIPVVLPDVVVESLTVSPANPVGGQSITFSARVKNIGALATPTGTAIGVRYSILGNAITTWGTVPGPLAPGASVLVGTQGGAWRPQTGTYRVEVWVDDVNRFAEADETNNKEIYSVIVGNPSR